MMHVAIVAEHNIKAVPEEDKKNRPYPKHYVWIRKPWEASPSNPDPVTPHPIPVFINRQHKGSKDWEPLPVGTRVLVGEVDKTPLNPEGLAVIAMGPQTDAILTDTRETAHYRQWQDGGIDQAVPVDQDPVAGPNADYGRTHKDGSQMGYESRGPYPSDPTRRQMELTIPGITVTFDHRTDDSTWAYKVQVAGTSVIYDLIFDAIAQTATLKDDKGNQFQIDSAANKASLLAVAEVTVDAPTIKLGAGATLGAVRSDAATSDGATIVSGISGKVLVE